MRPQLVASALEAGLLASTRRLLLDLVTSAARGDPWATASVLWVLQLLAQLLLAATATAGGGSEGGALGGGVAGDAWGSGLLSEVCQQLGRVAAKVLAVPVLQGAEAGRPPASYRGGAAVVAAAAAAVERISVPKLQAVCFEAVALAVTQVGGGAQGSPPLPPLPSP